LRLIVNQLADEGHIPYASLRSGLLSLFEGYKYPDEKRRSEGMDSLKEYYEQFSRQFGYKIKYPIMAIQGVGQRLMFQNKIKESIAIFKLGIQQHPGIWVNNIMLALALYKDNNIELARKYYLKAKEIDEDEMVPPFPEFKEMKKKFE